MGIQLYGDYCEVLNNVIMGATVILSTDILGIWVYTSSTYCIIDGNIIRYFDNNGSGDGIAIQINGSDRVMTVCNNICVSNDQSFDAPAPTLISLSGNYFP